MIHFLLSFVNKVINSLPKMAVRIDRASPKESARHCARHQIGDEITDCQSRTLGPENVLFGTASRLSQLGDRRGCGSESRGAL